MPMGWIFASVVIPPRCNSCITRPPTLLLSPYGTTPLWCLPPVVVLLLGVVHLLVVHLLVVLSPCGRLWQRLPPTPPALLPPCGASSLRRKPSSPPKYTCLSKFGLIRYALSSKKQKEIVATSTTTHQAPSLLVLAWRLTRLTKSSAYKSSHPALARWNTVKSANLNNKTSKAANPR